jgi:hypothetical protein
MLTILKSLPTSLLRRVLIATLLLVGGLGVDLGLNPPPPAQANVVNFFVGGRRNRGGRATNRQKGGGVRAGRLIGGLDSRIPYVITPRNTFQASDQFTIRWHPVEGTTLYTVRLWQWGDASGERQRWVWQTTSTDTTVVYNGDPPLAEELFYSIEVITDQGISSELDAGCATAGFAVLFPETRSRLQTDLSQIDRTDLTPEQLALAQAEVYLNYQMLNAAIETLTTQLALTPTDTLHLALGDFYSLTGLNALARSHYTQALDLATVNQDYLWQALAQEGLGEIAVLDNNLTAALTQLEKARGNYQTANIPHRANQTGQRIAVLQTAQQRGIPPTDQPETCTPSPLVL